MENQTTFNVPEGWELVNDVKADGTRVKYYTNVLGQKFYNEEDLMRNIKDAKERGLGIYDPNFDASSIVHKGPRKRSAAASSTNPKKEKPTRTKRCNKNSHPKEPTTCKKPDVETQHNEQPKRPLSHLSDQAEGTSGGRTSRRLAGLQPELSHDFDFNKPLEYIIKDKSN